MGMPFISPFTRLALPFEVEVLVEGEAQRRKLRVTAASVIEAAQFAEGRVDGEAPTSRVIVVAVRMLAGWPLLIPGATHGD